MMTRIAGDWENDNFSQFMRNSDYNARATSENYRPIFQKFIQIDRSFGKLMEIINRPEEQAPATFAPPSHSAYRASAMLALSGQNNEAMMVMRGCIERSLYAFHLFKHPEDYDVWANRHDSETHRKDVRNKFVIRRMLDDLKQHNTHCGEVAENLYEFTIDYGAHPNIFGELARMEIQRTEKEDVIVYKEVDLGSEFHKVCLKRTVQTGVACLKIFALIFPERFAITGLDTDVDKASNGL